MSLATVKKAIVAEIARLSGYDPGRVFWSDQNVNQPPTDYIDLSLSSAAAPGQDGIKQTFIADRPNGQEIKLEVFGYRETILSIEVFTKATTDNVDDPAASALEIAERIKAGLILPGTSDRLWAAGVAAFDLTAPTQWIPSIVATGFRGRATWDVRINIPAAAVYELTGYIATASGVLTVHGGTVDPSDVPFVGT